MVGGIMLFLFQFRDLHPKIKAKTDHNADSGQPRARYGGNQDGTPKKRRGRFHDFRVECDDE